jgi:ribosomal RNA-processing protein 12
LREVAIAVRKVAWDTLSIIVDQANGPHAAQFVTMLCAGLAGQPLMRACTVDALAKFLYEVRCLEAAAKVEMVQVVLVLLLDTDRQVYNAAVRFLKIVVLALSRDDLLPLLPVMLTAFDSPFAPACRLRLRRLLQRLLRKVEFDELQKAFPDKHVRLLLYIEKMAHRHRAKPGDKKAPKKEDSSAKDKSFQEVRDESDDEEDENKKEAWASSGFSKKEVVDNAEVQRDIADLLDDLEDGESDEDSEFVSRKPISKTKRARAEDATHVGARWLKEDADVPIDFMTPQAAAQVLVTAPNPRKKRKQEGMSDVERLRAAGLQVGEDGKLVLLEEAEEEPKENPFLASKKDPAPKKKAVSKLTQLRNVRAQKKAAQTKKRGHTVRGFDDFAPGRGAGGDAMRKGAKVEPFAYLKLNPRLAKEKKKTKAMGTINKVVRKAKVGTEKGMKARKANQRKVQKTSGKKSAGGKASKAKGKRKA